MNSHSDYIKRFAKVFEFIEANLNRKLALEEIAAIAHFSPYHFHRIFKSVTGEPLNAYIIRKRIEKSANKLLHSKLQISEIAFFYGFNDVSSFNRSFKKFYGVNPSEFKTLNNQQFSKIRQLQSKNGQVKSTNEVYLRQLEHLEQWILMTAKIDITTFNPFHLVYIPVIGPQNLGPTFNKLISWATPQGLMNKDTKVITVYHDSFKFTPAHKVRMSASLWVNDQIKPEENVSHKTFEPGKCICARFKIGVQDFEKSWTSLFLWMNENGFKKSDKDPFEIYHNNFNEHPDGIAIVDFCIPIL